MPSRLKSIRLAVETIVSAQISGVTIINEPTAADDIPSDQLPAARILFAETEPERLDFKQERRKVIGEVLIVLAIVSGATREATIDIVDTDIQDIRDAIFADEDLGATVDDVSCDSGTTVSSRDDEIVYGNLEIVTEEVF